MSAPAVAVGTRRAPAESRPTGWWGMAILIATEATLFALLLATYFYLRFKTPAPWPPDGIAEPKVLKPLIATIILVASSIPLALSGRAARRQDARVARAALVAGILLGIAFLIFQHVLVAESLDEFGPRATAYGSIFYTIVRLHAAHVVAGVLLAAWTLLRTWRFDRKAVLAVRVTALYWHFVNVVAVLVFLVLYLSPHGG
jgi:heme/copper-type cytochrome/quinol oxidase subunit 3